MRILPPAALQRELLSSRLRSNIRIGDVFSLVRPFPSSAGNFRRLRNLPHNLNARADRNVDSDVIGSSAMFTPQLQAATKALIAFAVGYDLE